MHLAAYLRILRPVRTLGTALVYGGFSWLWAHSLFGASSQETLFLVLAIIGPALLGSLLTGPIHEVMHRSFFPFLPNARQQLLRWHGTGVAISALLLLVPAALLCRLMPAPALLGYIVIGLALPALNRRRRTWGLIRPFYLGLIALGMIIALAGPRILFLHIGQQHPWAVLFGGLTAAMVCLRVGFSPAWTIGRWQDPHLFCFQSVIPLFSGGMLTYAQQQGQQLGAQWRYARTTARAWQNRNVGQTLSEWCAVLHHARFGAISPLRLWITTAIASAITTPVFFVTLFLLNKTDAAGSSLTAFCQSVVAAAAPGRLHAAPTVGLLFGMPPAFTAVLAVITALALFNAPQNFPITRTRLADCAFLETLKHMGRIWISYAVVTFGGLVLIGLTARGPVDLALFSRSLTALLVALPLTLAVLALFIRSLAWRFWRTVAFVAGFLVTIVGMTLSTIVTDQLFTPLGLLVWLVLTPAAVWLCWTAFRHCYRTSDLLALSEKIKINGFANCSA